VSIALDSGWLAPRRYRVRRIFIEAGSAILGVVLLIWSLLPIYNMFLVALDPEEGEVAFTGNVWLSEPSLEAFWVVVTQADRFLEDFWRQFGNSMLIGAMTMILTVLIGSMASFAVDRMRLSRGSLIINTALFIYVIPASFLIFPFHQIMYRYGLYDNYLAAIAAHTTFAIPFAILILHQYARLIPVELDDAARVEGASVVQVYRHIYLPLMMPALAAVAIYAMMFAWNDYVYQFVLFSSPEKLTVSVTQAGVFEDNDAPWNAMMASGIIYALVPMAMLFALRRFVTTGLTSVATEQ
jgi:multiple sugar transport system permease protein